MTTPTTRSAIPKRCPFCAAQDVVWKEYRVRTFVERYFDGDTGNFAAPRDEGVDVWCTRCEEHIRQEDMIEDSDDLSICCGAGITDDGRCSDCKECVR